MVEAMLGAVLLMLVVRALSNGPAIEFEDLVGWPQLIAFVLVALLLLYVLAGPADSPARHGLSGMLLLAVGGLILILFPERMPDTARGGTLLTAFWSLFGWLALAVAWLVVARLST